jgi:hypothetical protein
MQNVQKMSEREAMVRRVREILGNEQANLWWQTPNPDLGGVPPLWMTPPTKRRALYHVIKTKLVKTAVRHS